MNIAIVTPTTRHRDMNDRSCNFFTHLNFDLIQDQIGAMLSQEKKYQIHPNTSHDDDLSSRQGHIEVIFLPKEEWRKKICEWSYRVVDHFRMDREVVAMSINILDRYLYAQQAITQTNNDSHVFRLVAVSALIVTLKVR